MTTETKKQKTFLEDLLLFVIGCLFFSVSLFTTLLPSAAQFLVFTCGMCLLIISTIDLCRLMFKMQLPAPIEKLKVDKSGIVWIWIAGLGLALPFCALIYWCLDYPLDLIMDTMVPLYTMTGTMAYAWTATEIIISYLLAFCVIYAVLWVIINSKSPSGVYYS